MDARNVFVTIRIEGSLYLDTLSVMRNQTKQGMIVTWPLFVAFDFVFASRNPWLRAMDDAKEQEVSVCVCCM